MEGDLQADYFYVSWHFRLQAIFVIRSMEDLFQDQKLQPLEVTSAPVIH